MAKDSLKKRASTLRAVYKLYKRKRHKLPVDISEKIRRVLMELQEALLNRDLEKTAFFADELEVLAKKYLKRSPFEQVFESALSLSFALLIAVIIRATSFEPFEIPSGSMRPTFKEQDRLIVSKTQFGLNIPLSTSHLFFHPEEVKRMGVVVFTGENMDIPNVKTKHFYLFPGYKQYIKRMIGLPGDTLYFHGGKIYGIDKEGNDISKELQLESLHYLEHIPFIHIEGKVSIPKAPIHDVYSSVVLHQMNKPLAKLHLSPKKEVHYELLPSSLNPQLQQETHLDLYDFWGMEHFASARILPRQVIEKKKDLSFSLQLSDYYLELTHHASLKKAALMRDPFLRLRPMVHVEKSYIPLTKEHMKAIWDHMYTGRFLVQEGHIFRYGADSHSRNKNTFAPKLRSDIPNGTYEFTQGKLYQVKFQGVPVPVAEDHPLAQFDPLKCFILFNAGIECDTRFIPQTVDQSILPVRYAYFRDESLYLMGAPIFTKEDPSLVTFLKNEETLQSIRPSYTPFIGKAPPLKPDGSLDKEFIKLYGVKVPEKHYLVLGDNHAMSADSRDFGFVPQDNIRGTPLFMFWAPGGRFGFPNHGIYSFFTLPRLIVWTYLATFFALWTYHDYRQKRLPFYFDRLPKGSS